MRSLCAGSNGRNRRCRLLHEEITTTGSACSEPERRTRLARAATGFGKPPATRLRVRSAPRCELGPHVLPQLVPLGLAASESSATVQRSHSTAKLVIGR